MAKSVLELAVGTGQWDAGLKKAKSALDNFTQSQGGLQQALAKDSENMRKFVSMMGQTESTAKTAKGQMNDYKATIEQLTMQYNRMTDAQKESIGQDYLQSIDQLKQKYQAVNEEIQEMNRSLNNVKAPDIADGVKAGGLFGGGKLDGMLQVFGGNLMTKAAGAVANLASEMYGMVQQGIELAKSGEGIRIAFERLGRGDILDGLRKATHGTVTDLELMKAAVKFNDFKLPVEELGTMLAFAQQKAKDTGQSIDYMVDSIVTGLGRKSLMILDNLGLSAAEIKEKMAETGDMTKAVGEIIREQMAKAGDYVETAADRAAQANVNLQNKMEELGRKFAPLQEASNNLWTSMKMGIMDLIGGPLTNFINKLTEAGRTAQQYGVLGGNSKVGKLTTNLINAREGNRQSIYQQQQEQFWRYINPREQQIRDIRAWQRGERGEALQGRINAITEKYGSLDATKIQAEVDAAKKMLSDYQKAAKTILAPVEANISTNDAINNVESLKVKLAELEAQRKKAIAAGDTELSKNLLKQINQTKADIRGLDTTTLKTSTGSKTTPQEKAYETYKKAQHDYQQALEQAALEVKAGTINSAEAKKKELQANESLWKSIGDARETYDSPKLKEAQAKVEQDIVRLGGEVKKATDAQKRVDQAARELEQAQKKLSDAQRELATARESGKLKDIYAAEKNVTTAQKEVTRMETIKVNVEKGTVDLPDIPKEVEQIVSTKVGDVITPEVATDIVQTISTRLGDIVTPEIAEQLTQTINTKVGEVVTPDVAKELTQVVNVVPGMVELPDIPKEVNVPIVANTENIDAEISHLKEKLGGLEIGSLDFNLKQENLVDMTTLQTMINAQMKAGLKIDPEITKNLMNQIISGADIADSTWEDLMNSINEKLKELKMEPIKIDFKTGTIAKDGKDVAKEWNSAANAISSVGSAMQSIEDPAAKVAGTVAQAIATMALAYAQASAATSNEGWGWIAFAATGLATMISSISAIHSATGYANGGIVKGNSYSGDNIPAMVGGPSGELVGLNAGEVVLNKAAQSNLANQLQGNNMSNMRLVARVKGTDLLFSLENTLQMQGYGKIATWG